MKDEGVKMIKICEFCGKEFEVPNSKHGQRKRFCNTSCSAKWRNKTYGPNLISEETKRKNAKILSDRWKDTEFRKKKTEYGKRPGALKGLGSSDKMNAPSGNAAVPVYQGCCSRKGHFCAAGKKRKARGEEVWYSVDNGFIHSHDTVKVKKFTEDIS